ncbi:MAG: beta-N-acetylhexosaminidase [Micavibrio sp.]|nr:beta-N-acetylhexosaminidase [Micavibrio sp.]|tara:strand:+ start:6262 stop:7263 length:1002 start_codon:yes stop_codon:yes gene_type:complete
MSTLYDVDANARAVVFGLSGTSLNDAERAFFQEANPFGYILFKRNVETPDQVRALCDSLRDLSGRNCPILIDQEGGRVQRLNTPNWRAYPDARSFGEKAERSLDEGLEALRFNSLQMIEDLKICGINVNCTPVADVLAPETHDVIGDRAFSSRADIVSRMALSVCRHYLASGVVPIMKHIPGHGRAAADSHLELPVVDAEAQSLQAIDFKPFADIAASEIGAQVWAMSAHVIYSAFDAEKPATISASVIEDVIRGTIGFNGVLISDDLDMKALASFGDPAEMAAESLQAGCDLALHCSGNMDVMAKIAEKTPKLAGSALKRLQSASEFRKLAA